MPIHNLAALLDDITALLDDVATMTKLATKKTAGVLGDDLALNAQQLTGISAAREIPVVKAVAMGSFRNKAILVPAALAISAIAPWAVEPLLMVGGAFLCFEGVEKLAHRWLHTPEEDAAHAKELHDALVDPNVDLVALEKERIKGAVRTDFILSAEILVISLGTVSKESFPTRIAVLVVVAILMTFGVYGLVGAIVKLDDLGLYLRRQSGAAKQKLGSVILAAAPKLMKFLSVAGTVAMFLVGGGIIVHGTPFLHHASDAIDKRLSAIPSIGGVLGSLATSVLGLLVGLLVGAIVLGVVMAVKKVIARTKRTRAA